MSDTNPTYIPAELVGDHYRPIGGEYESLDKAIEAIEAQFRNKHGGGGSFQVFKPETVQGTVALVEAAPIGGDAFATRGLYKVVERGL